MFTGKLSGYCFISFLVVSLFAVHTDLAQGKEFEFVDITSFPGSPGQGRNPSINDSGDVAFYDNDAVYFYDRSEGIIINITTLPGAPTTGRYPKLNNLGDILFWETQTRYNWFYDSDSQSFTNISTSTGAPEISQAYSPWNCYGLNDGKKVSFHSGDHNFGDIYVYDHMSAAFQKVTDQPGFPTHGRENRINNLDQVVYMGFPDAYVYDLVSGVTTNITDLPGGPGTMVGSYLDFNDNGDLLMISVSEITFYDAATSTFKYLSGLPGFPSGSAAGSYNSLSNRGEITFWRDSLYYYDPFDDSFTLLNGQGEVPAGGMQTSINDVGLIALAAGYSSVEELFLAIPVLRGDVDGDSDVDLNDYESFADCMTGPQNGSVVGICNAFDFEPDHDVDLADFAVFQANYSD